MRAISLTQPWANAIAVGVKGWETRSWATTFRGELAIHAAKGVPTWAREWAVEQRISVEPRGAIVCVVDLASCWQTEKALREVIGEMEQKWGDYGDGRFCFQLTRVRRMQEAVTCKGALGIWTVPEDVEKLVREQLR